MAKIPQVASSISAVIEQGARCATSETSDSYDYLDTQVEALDGQARETVQSHLDIASLLPKLKGRKPLGPDDLKTLELLIVGDAECFLKYETNLASWKDQVKELMAEIGKLQTSTLDIDSLMHLRALCQEMRRVLPGIVYYLDQKERTAKFQEATKGPIDDEGYRVLTEMVTAMISSDKM